MYIINVCNVALVVQVCIPALHLTLVSTLAFYVSCIFASFAVMGYDI